LLNEQVQSERCSVFVYLGKFGLAEQVDTLDIDILARDGDRLDRLVDAASANGGDHHPPPRARK